MEAATRCGRADLATDALNRLAIKAGATGTHWARGIEARARALLTDGAHADRWFRTAIDHLRRTRVQAELARTQLLYGEWLRRDGRRLDARGELNTAHEMFVSMGMDAFAERAANELAATGEKRRQRISEPRDVPHRPGTPNRRTCPRWALERPDRRPPVPQPAHRRMALATRLLEA